MAVTRVSTGRRTGGIRVDLDDGQVDAILSELKHMPKEMGKARLQAVKDTLRTGRAQLSRKIGGNKGAATTLKAGDVKDKIPIIKQPTSDRSYGVISISDKAISLHKYAGTPKDPVSQKGRRREDRRSKKKEQAILDAGGKPGREPPGGASWKVYRDEKRIRRKNFFVTYTKKGKGPYIMKRPLSSNRGGKRAVAGKDYRIAYGPSIAEIVERKKILKPAIADMRAVLKKNLLSQVDRFLKRAKKSA